MTEGELQKRIIDKAKLLECGEPYLVKATRYKAGLMIVDREDLSAIVEEAEKEWLAIEETELPLKVNGKVDWEKTAQLMEIRNILRLRWLEKWLGASEEQQK